MNKQPYKICFHSFFFLYFFLFMITWNKNHVAWHWAGNLVIHYNGLTSVVGSLYLSSTILSKRLQLTKLIKILFSMECLLLIFSNFLEHFPFCVVGWVLATKSKHFRNYHFLVIINNLISFHLWWLETMLKREKLYKCCVQDWS